LDSKGALSEHDIKEKEVEIEKNWRYKQKHYINDT